MIRERLYAIYHISSEWDCCVCVSVWSKVHYQQMTSIFSSDICTLCTLQDKATALVWAAIAGHTDVVQVLLSRQDVDINIRDKVC